MQMQRGQKVKIEEFTGDGNFSVEVELNMKKGTADITCFGVDSENKLSDDRYFVFYNQTSSPKGEIILKDNGNKTCFEIHIRELPDFVKKLVFTIALDGDGSMKDLEKGEMKILTGGGVQASFSLSGNDFISEKAVILCEIYEKAGVWRVSPVGSGFNGGLSNLLAYYGGEETGKSATAPLPLIPDLKTPQKLSPEPEKRTVVSLKKSGDTHKISLTKSNGTIHANLNWNKIQKKGLFGGNKSVDIDLACMYRLVTGEMGVIQALGGGFGSETAPPYIRLDQDDRTGANVNGENMFFSKPGVIDFAVVFAFIYEGVANWRETDAIVTLSQPGEPNIEIPVENGSSNERFCVIASMASRNGHLEVKKEEKFFRGHREVDAHYGFGLQWRNARK